MPITAEQLQKLKISPEWVNPLNETFERFDISTPLRQACFVGQAAHESGNFKRLQEGLSYSAERLMAIWPKRFPTLEVAQKYARNEKALANYVYANRMGNKDGIIDGVGDVMVCMVNYCALQDIDLVSCMESAYDTIKNRTGTLLQSGVFVKD